MCFRQEQKKMNDFHFVTLGIDTSNYTTSLSLVENGKIISNTRRLLPVAENERGLRQSDALFHHTKALPELFDELFVNCKNLKGKICAVGVSSRPRNSTGSYMPCFLAGISAAKAISSSLGVPLYEFSHQQGHIEAAVYSSLIPENTSEFISFHISGGTTDIVLCKREKGGNIDCFRIGGTTDLNAGQAIDRTGVLMGLRFPCGKELDELSRGSNVDFEKIKVSVNNFECSLSGLENKTKKLIENSTAKEDIAAFLFEYLSTVISKLCDNLESEYPCLPILFAGGVMSNTRIRENISKRKNVYFASAALSSDNACGTALLAYNKYKTENN